MVVVVMALLRFVPAYIGRKVSGVAFMTHCRTQSGLFYFLKFKELVKHLLLKKEVMKQKNRLLGKWYI